MAKARDMVMGYLSHSPPILSALFFIPYLLAAAPGYVKCVAVGQSQSQGRARESQTQGWSNIQ